MKKIIALFATVVFLTTIGIVAVGKKLPSVGYVLVGPSNDGGWSMRHSQGFDSLKKHGYSWSWFLGTIYSVLYLKLFFLNVIVTLNINEE